MTKIWMWIMILGCFCQFPIKAETVEVELKHYQEATRLAEQRRFNQAAQQWHQLSVSFLLAEKQLGKRKMWQYAGLAEALAAISADKVNNIIAYRYWADSTRYFMTGGTNWALMKKQLQHRYEIGNRLLLTFMQAGGLSADDILQQDLSMLQIWHDKLAIFSFTSPKLGLSARKAAAVTVAPEQNSQASFNNRQAGHHSAFQPNKALTGLASVDFPDQQVIPREEFSTPDTLEADSSLATQPTSALSISELSISELSILGPPASELSASELSNTEPAIVKPVAVPSSMSVTVHPPARGTTLTSEHESVEAIQRRSFAPVPEKKED